MSFLGNGLIVFACLISFVRNIVQEGTIMKSHYLELTRPEHAYLFGFIQADGHLSRDPRYPNKGKLQIELSARDFKLLGKLQEIIPVKTTITSRVRITNFSKGEAAQTYTLLAYDLKFRQELELLGVPRGKKSKDIAPPSLPFSEEDYYRGILDGDGSLGLTSKNYPFVSLVTASDHLKHGYLAFIKKVTGEDLQVVRNKRDGVYNIMVTREAAQTLTKVLYYKGSVSLERKKDKANVVLCWERPKDTPRIEFSRKKWTKEEDAVVLELPPEESSLKLNRTMKSVSIRKWRLTGSQQYA